MTDNEIIKALEEELKTALIINHRFEESNDTENPDDHKFIALLSNTIKLIKRQQAEIERLQAEQMMTEGYADALEERAKAEAIKEFAENLKKDIQNHSFEMFMNGLKGTPRTHEITYETVWEYIDNLVKEMTEGV